jgi:hypothetical protein
MLLPPRLPTVMMKFPFHVSNTVLLWFRVMVHVMLRFLSRAPVFLAFPPPPPLIFFALNLPCRLMAAADALSGMVDSDMRLLLLLHYSISLLASIWIFDAAAALNASQFRPLNATCPLPYDMATHALRPLHMVMHLSSRYMAY